MQTILFVSHCLLNPEVRADGISKPDVNTVKAVGKLMSGHDVLLEQLPCPEFSFLGKRAKMPKDEYEKIAGFREHCTGLAQSVVKTLEDFKGIDHKIIIGIARSLSCSLSKVYRGEKLVNENGIFIEEIKKRTGKNIKFLEIDYKNFVASVKHLNRSLPLI
ncbi:MAG: 2-thiouracil desulfurase family protein [bacterium]|nr:2-thiouracil desulfurase family protein [bacterium]